MATATEIRQFATEHGCTDAIALKVLTLQNANARLIAALLALVIAEENYGLEDNVALNEAWAPANSLLIELKAR